MMSTFSNALPWLALWAAVVTFIAVALGKPRDGGDSHA